MENLFNIGKEAIGLLPGGNILKYAAGVLPVLDSLFGGTKRQIDPEVQRLLNKKKGAADKLEGQSQQQEAVRQAQATDIRQNLEGALMDVGGKAANVNTGRGDVSVPQGALKTAIRAEAPIAQAITQGLTGARSEAESRKAQLTEQSGQMNEQVARATEELTREYDKTSAFDTGMQSLGIAGLTALLGKDNPDDTTGETNKNNPDMSAGLGDSYNPLYNLMPNSTKLFPDKQGLFSKPINDTSVKKELPPLFDDMQEQNKLNKMKDYYKRIGQIPPFGYNQW